MTSVITFAPIAAQLSRSVSLDDLCPRSSVEEVLRGHREHTSQSDELELPHDVLPFFGHYCAVTRAAVRLLGAPAFAALARFHDEVEDEYMPGGPPQSPVYDSFAMQFTLSAVPQGIGNETPYSVLARGTVFLAGVPDRPELLPHSHEFQGAAEPRLPPAAEFRKTLLQTAMKDGLFEFALRELHRLGGTGGADLPALTPNEQNLLAAYATLGVRAADGTTALTRLERSRGAASMHPDLRSFIVSLKSGWFTVLRVDRIHLDKGLEAFDLLRGERLQVSERSATRQLRLGDLLLGWLCKDPTGTITLEGGLAHVPSFTAAPFLSLVAELRRQMPPLADEQAWKLSAADLPLPLLAGIIELRSNRPLPTMTNTSGDPLEPATGHYRIRDRARVSAALRREFLENGDGSYRWVDEAGTLLARFELSTGMLRVQVNSKKRLNAVQQRLEGLLSDVVERSLEVHEDMARAVRAHQPGAGKAGAKAQPLELSPELAAELHNVVLAKIRSSLDEPIPQFKGKTLRQLARSVKGRADAISWLREQERILKFNPQLAGLDLRPLWQELALPFQGLETDPPL